MQIDRKLPGIISLILFILLSSCQANPKNPALAESAKEIEKESLMHAESWEEADLLFHQDENWMGGDGAFTIPLGENKVLWLFGDSFIATSDNHKRRESTLVRNSIAVQEGLNPATAEITFYWDKSDNEPTSYFGERNNAWYWPMHGMTTDKNRLIIFLYRIVSDDNALGFIVDGYEAVMVDNYRQSPDEWELQNIPVPENQFNICTGVSLFREREFIYSYGVQEPGNHWIYLARWKETDFAEGNLLNPEWWNGKNTGWISDDKLTSEPGVMFPGGATEFSISESPTGFIHIQSRMIGGEIAIRTAPAATGRWSLPESVFTVPTHDIPQIFIYAGKGHPELEGADIVVTYATNTMSFDTLFDNREVYYPKFVKINFTE